MLELNEFIVDTVNNVRDDNLKQLDVVTKSIIKKIPPTNEELLKEVQQMRDDFLALRQNF